MNGSSFPKNQLQELLDQGQVLDVMTQLVNKVVAKVEGFKDVVINIEDSKDSKDLKDLKDSKKAKKSKKSKKSKDSKEGVGK